MEHSESKLVKILAFAIIATGAVLYFSYLVYLPAPGLFETKESSEVGLIFYGLATAGSAFVTWGLILGQLTGTGLDKSTILKASGIGFGMLGIMRLGTAIFPHAPFDQMIALPVTEFFLFSFLSLKLYRS